MPHSDIHGSKPARGSPWLFAACHVLHRLLVPRHPPNALIVLNPSNFIRSRYSGGHLTRFSALPVLMDKRPFRASSRKTRQLTHPSACSNKIHPAMHRNHPHRSQSSVTSFQLSDCSNNQSPPLKTLLHALWEKTHARQALLTQHTHKEHPSASQPMDIPKTPLNINAACCWQPPRTQTRKFTCTALAGQTSQHRTHPQPHPEFSFVMPLPSQRNAHTIEQPGMHGGTLKRHAQRRTRT